MLGGMLRLGFEKPERGTRSPERVARLGWRAMVLRRRTIDSTGIHVMQTD